VILQGLGRLVLPLAGNPKPTDKKKNPGLSQFVRIENMDVSVSKLSIISTSFYPICTTTAPAVTGRQFASNKKSGNIKLIPKKKTYYVCTVKYLNNK
jgi:hypothetical protein